MTATIRLMQAEDLTAVGCLQDSCYGEALFESHELLSQRLQQAPASCWLIESVGTGIQAYLFSYPSVSGAVTPLAAPFSCCKAPDCLYLHDMAVSPQARGLKLSSKLLQQAIEYAERLALPRLALVAVQDSVPYWQRQGFIVVSDLPVKAINALASYQPGQAHYMQLDLLSRQPA